MSRRQARHDACFASAVLKSVPTRPTSRNLSDILAPKGDVWMGAKQLAYADEARQKLLTGVSKLARAVRATLGPRGRNAVLDKGWGSPTVTKDRGTGAE